MRHIKAAVLEEDGRLVIKELDVPSCDKGEVIVKVEVCGICRTDLKCVKYGQRDLALPRILGHEMAGTIVQVGAGVSHYQEGERVQIFPGISCGKCLYCKTGLDNLCSSLNIMGFNYDGGFQEYLRIPAVGVDNGILHKLSPEITWEEAAVVEPLACCVNMQDALAIANAQTMLIFGAGRLGLLNMRLAKASGIEKVIAVEKDETRVAVADSLGFDYVINPVKKNLLSEVKALTGNRGVDVVINCCPDPNAFTQGLELLAKKGKYGFFSGLIMDKETSININSIHYKEITMVGAYGCNLKSNNKALQLLADKKVMVQDLFTKTIGLNEVQEGINLIDDDLNQLIILVKY